MLTANGVYPAPGLRDSGWRGTNAGGTLYFVGYSGFSWASSFTGTSGYAMAFDCGAIYPNNNYNRSNGFSLRCLQE